MSNQPPRNYWDDITRFWSGLRLGDRFRAAVRFPYAQVQAPAQRLRSAYGVPNPQYRVGWSGGWPELTTTTPVQYRGPGSSYTPRTARAPGSTAGLGDLAQSVWQGYWRTFAQQARDFGQAVNPVRYFRNAPSPTSLVNQAAGQYSSALSGAANAYNRYFMRGLRASTSQPIPSTFGQAFTQAGRVANAMYTGIQPGGVPVYLPQQAYMSPEQWSGRPYEQPTPPSPWTVPNTQTAGGPFYYLRQGRAGPERPEDMGQVAYERWAAKAKAYGSQAYRYPQPQQEQPYGGYGGGGYGGYRRGGYGGGRTAYTPTTYTPREQAYRVATQLPPSPDIPGWLYQLVTWQI